MHAPLSRISEHAYALLRLVSGLLFSCHGLQKLFGLLDGHQPAVGSQLWFGGVIELVCGAAIAVGMFAPLAAFLASGTMAVAYVQFHWKLRVGAAFFPVVNEGELAVVYCFLFFFLASRGSGRWSLDARRARLRDADRTA